LTAVFLDILYISLFHQKQAVKKQTKINTQQERATPYTSSDITHTYSNRHVGPGLVLVVEMTFVVTQGHWQ